MNCGSREWQKMVNLKKEQKDKRGGCKMSEREKRNRRNRKSRRKIRHRNRLLKLLILVAAIVLVCGATFAGVQEKHVEIIIKAENLSIMQEAQVPVLTAEISLQGKGKIILDTKNKFSANDLLDRLKSGEGYTLSCETDGISEGEYPITVQLDSELEELLLGEWKDKVVISTQNAVLTVENKYGSWEENRFKRTDGSYVTNDFIVSKGSNYYFNADGIMAVGWQETDDENGIMTVGWYKENGHTYYLDDDGKMHTGWYEENDKKYYFASTGEMVVGELKVGISVYTFDENGVMVSEKKEIDPTKPMIALTFDDGPGEKTMDLLNALEKYKAHATFFMCGTSLSKKEIDADAILKKMDAIGCDTSNHTMTHPKLDSLSPEQIISEVQGVSNIISSHIGHGAVSLRPPYGSGIHEEKVTKNVGLPMIYWSVDTLDWKTKSKEKTVESVLSEARDGSIILMHDIHEWSVEAAIEVIPKLIEQGYQLVTVSELAAARGITLEPGVTYFNFYPTN